MAKQSQKKRGISSVASPSTKAPSSAKGAPTKKVKLSATTSAPVVTAPITDSSSSDSSSDDSDSSTSVPKDALSRLRRFGERTKKRGVYPDKLPLWMGADLVGHPERTTRREALTPFGPAGLSTQRFSGPKPPTQRDPQTTTRKKDFPKTYDPGAPYSEILSEIDHEDVRDLSKAFRARREGKTQKMKAKKQRTQRDRNMATFYSVTHDSEQLRTGGQAKQARSLVHLIADKDPDLKRLMGVDAKKKIPIKKAFALGFPVSNEDGKKHPSLLLSGKRAIGPVEKHVLENASDSSDSDAEDPFDLLARRRDLA